MLLSRFRPLIFWLVICAFVVTASLVLFYAFGYRYSFERGIFIFSGSITVKTIPETVNIEVDNESIPRKRLGLLNNSIHITGLMPGEHRIKISAPGYKSWEKRVVIESGVSREFWNIILPHEHYPNETLVGTQQTEKIFPHPTDANRFALIKQQANETSLVFFNYRTHESKQVFSLPNASYDTQGDNLEWSWFENGRFVVLPLRVGGTPQHFVLDTSTSTFFSIEERFGLSQVASVRFATGRSHTLIFRAQETLYRFALNSNAPLENVSDTTLAYSLSDDILFLLTTSGEVWQEDGDRLVTITPPLPLAAKSSVALTVYDEDHLALLEKNGERRLFLVYPNPNDNQPTIKEVGRMVQGMQFSNDGKKLLFFGENEIGVAFTDDWEVQPRRKVGEVVQVARFADSIKNVGWAENYEHITFSQGNIVKFIELDGRDYRFIGEIQSLPAPPTQIFPLFSDNHLFFVVPGYDITSIVFPEPQGLFGQ